MNLDDYGIGVDYPFQRGNDGYFEKTYTSLDQTRANIINVLATRRGERIMNPEFGTNIYRILFEQSTKQIEGSIRVEVENAVNRWVPYVNIQNISISRSPENNAIILDILFTTEFSSNNKEENLQLWFSSEDVD